MPWLEFLTLGFVLFAPAPTVAGNNVGQVAACDEADAPSSETCRAFAAPADRTLRWRAQPYDKVRGGVYGGKYITEAFAKRFYGPVADDDWDVLWTMREQVGNLLRQKLPPRAGRLVNHCRYFRAAGQKCYFAGHVRRVAEALRADPERSAQFSYLRNYVLNHKEQLEQWRREARANPERPWVMKDCSAGMSQGVEVLRGSELLHAAANWKPVGSQWTVVQEYLHRPFLGFGMRKFHLRVYTLVTRWGPPPSVLIFDEGVVFRSRHVYKHETLSTERDVFSSIGQQVEALPFAAFWDALDDRAASGQGVGAAEVRARMAAVVRAMFGEALDASFGDAIKETRPDHVGFSCFDLFGLDVMFDEELRPFVLEVNTGPNLQIDDRGEESVKLLLGVKGLLMSQLVQWAASRTRATPGNQSAAREIEDLRLVNFTRVL